MSNYYLYRHIRLDNNEVFYIGIGTKPNNYNTWKQEYLRAYQSSGRTNHWKNIKNKSEINIEIIFESDNYNLIKEKEKEFIKLYGRKDLLIGTLINLTDGGDGTLGTPSIFKNKKSPERITREGIEKMRKSKIGKPLPQQTLKKAIEKRSIPIYQYSLDNSLLKEWFSASEASRVLNISQKSLSRAMLGKNKINKHLYKNYLWYNVKLNK